MRPRTPAASSRPRRLPRPSPAMAVALVALFVALGGSAFAAGHYLITSTRQISPRVLHRLKGDRGPRGLSGAQGPGGPQGPVGPVGPAGPVGSHAPLASGQSESGTFGAGGGSERGAAAPHETPEPSSASPPSSSPPSSSSPPTSGPPTGGVSPGG